MKIKTKTRKHFRRYRFIHRSKMRKCVTGVKGWRKDGLFTSSCLYTNHQLSLLLSGFFKTSFSFTSTFFFYNLTNKRDAFIFFNQTIKVFFFTKLQKLEMLWVSMKSSQKKGSGLFISGSRVENRMMPD